MRMTRDQRLSRWRAKVDRRLGNGITAPLNAHFTTFQTHAVNFTAYEPADALIVLHRHEIILSDSR
jgi:hypothetical protein